MVKMSKDEDFDPIARRMNLWLHNELKGNKDIQRNDTKHVIKEVTFLVAVENARKQLRLLEYYPDSADEEEVGNWIMDKLAGQVIGFNTISKKEWIKRSHRISDVVLQALEAANLQSGWYSYMEAYIALGKAPKTISPSHTLKIYVEGVSEDKNSLIIRLDKGLSSDDYRKAWVRLKRFLNKPSTAPVYADILKNKVYLDRQKGMSYGQLAEKYFSNEYAKDQVEGTDYARDKVKKIIGRYRKPKS